MRWMIVVVILLLLGFFSIIVASIMSLSLIGSGTAEDNVAGNVAVIPVKGIINTYGSNSLYNDNLVSSTDVIRFLEKADEDKAISAIVLEIDSPGGTPVASDEITQAIKRTEKPVIAWIREMGASGAYFLASACDHIIANRMSLTGSIGVRGSYLEFAGLMDRYNVTYRRLVAGKYKDMGSPYKEMTEKEKEKMQELLDSIHEVFIEEVASNRGLTEENVKKLATGEVYPGADAKEMGLVDEIGNKEAVLNHLEDRLNTTISFRYYRQPRSLIDVFGSVASKHGFSLGQGLASNPTRDGTPVLR